MVPTIYEVNRYAHIVSSDPSANTFRAHITRRCVLAKDRNLMLQKMDAVFERLHFDLDEAGIRFINPIRYDQDRFAEPRNQQSHGTLRGRIPDWALERLKQLIVKPDGQGGYTWNEEMKKIGLLSIVLSNGKTTFCPILPAIIYLMLVFPLRTHQTRWLDSGEMDEMCFDFNSGTFEPNTEKNVRRRTYGVIQPASPDSMMAAENNNLEFLVATNKTSLESRHKSSYTISYLPPDVLWVIKQVLEYQANYGPPPTLVKESSEPRHKRTRNQEMAQWYPDICPLFRYESQEVFFPPTHNQIAYFWGRLCGLWDRMSTTSKQPSHKLSRLYKKGDDQWEVAIYDLHSLRVAGVSKLLDAGLPLGIVAAIAGQKSLAMTMHYYRADMKVMRIKVHEAFRQLGNNNMLLEVANRIRSTADESGLIGTDDGFANLRRARETGLMNITMSGICPGTSCATGLDSKFQTQLGADVPGSRCALCKYHIYGPAFLVGMIMDYNCLLFELELKAHQQTTIRKAALDAEDRGDEGELLRLRGEDDRIDQESTLDLAVLARLNDMIDECVAMNNGDSAVVMKTGLELVTQESIKIGVAVEHVSKFRQLTDLAELAQVIPTTRHIAPSLAQVELKDRLLSLLYTNGANPYLAGLSKDASHKASLDLARLLESLIPEEDLRQDLLDGVLQLRDLPGVKEKVLDHVARSTSELPSSAPSGMSVLEN